MLFWPTKALMACRSLRNEMAKRLCLVASSDDCRRRRKHGHSRLPISFTAHLATTASASGRRRSMPIRMRLLLFHRRLSWQASTVLLARQRISPFCQAIFGILSTGRRASASSMGVSSESGNYLNKISPMKIINRLLFPSPAPDNASIGGPCWPGHAWLSRRRHLRHPSVMGGDINAI